MYLNISIHTYNKVFSIDVCLKYILWHENKPKVWWFGLVFVTGVILLGSRSDSSKSQIYDIN